MKFFINFLSFIIKFHKHIKIFFVTFNDKTLSTSLVFFLSQNHIYALIPIAHILFLFRKNHLRTIAYSFKEINGRCFFTFLNKISTKITFLICWHFWIFVIRIAYLMRTIFSEKFISCIFADCLGIKINVLIVNHNFINWINSEFFQKKKSRLINFLFRIHYWGHYIIVEIILI